MTETFHTPTKIILGTTAIEELATLIGAAGLKKVLCVYGSGSVKANGVYDRLIKGLKEHNVAFEELWGVQPNPLISKVREGVNICKDASKGIEAVIAVGGGSVLDSCKIIAAAAKMEADPWALFDPTASEYNAGSVISNPEVPAKLPAFTYAPVASAIDPSVQLSLPWRQVMCGAVDSLSHLLETYFATPNKDITTAQINFALQKSIIKSMVLIKKDPKDVEARANFAWAVSLALNSIAGFRRSQDWNVHYIEHAISAFNDKIAHAEGLAVVSLAYYPYIYEKGLCKEQFEDWAQEVFGVKDVKEAFGKLKELLALWEAPLTLQDLKLKAEDIPAIVKIEQFHQQKGAVSPVLLLSAEDTQKILEKTAGL